MKRGIWIGIIMLWALHGALAQEAPINKKGKVNGEWRTFYLHTFNKDDLKDFYAIGTGGHIGYTYTFTQRWKAGARLYTSLNTNIQDLSIPDATTGRFTRYEIGLFDVTDVDNKFIVLPGELFLTYTANHHAVTIGRMKRATPFLNPQDGRMIPTLVEGLWYQYKPSDKVNVQAGLLNRISPRGTRKFYRIGQSIGTFSGGRDTNGRPSQYPGNTNSDFIFITGITTAISPVAQLAAWNTYVDNVFNTIYLRPEFDLIGEKLTLSLEWAHQRKVGNGGNSIDSLSYFTAKYANLIGAQLALKKGRGKILIGYDYITDDGRFLFPREWGREGTFTFQKRERAEGSQNNHALVLSYDQFFEGENSRMRSVISVGHQWKPSPTDVVRNKYALPGYTHINLDISASTDKLKGLKPELLLTYKIGRNDFPENPNFILNKVDMFQINLVVNYQF